MLTLKCPNCGSYNDGSASECYFCKKELPTPAGKKRRKVRKPEEQKVDFSQISVPTSRRTSHPGCLMIYIFILFLIGGLAILQVINYSANLYPLDLHPLFEPLGRYGSDFLAFFENGDSPQFVFAILPIFIALFVFLLGWGLFLLQHWARMLAMLFQASLSISFIYLFYILLSRYYNKYDIPVSFIIVFFIILIGALLNLYLFVWFFENSLLFPKHRPIPS